MDIHKPKPVHNWRELLTEIGVIVVGIVIALSGEQIVEAFHWSHQIEVGEASLKDNFVRVVDNAAELEAQKDCVSNRLAQLDALVARAAASGRLPSLSVLGHPPFSPWRNAVWQGLTAGQTVAHMPHNKVQSYSTLAVQSDYLADLSDLEQDQWNTLGTLVGPGRKFTDVEAETLRMTLAKAHFSAGIMLSTSRIALDRIRATGMIDPATFNAAVKRAAALKSTAEICRPLEIGS